MGFPKLDVTTSRKAKKYLAKRSSVWKRILSFMGIISRSTRNSQEDVSRNDVMSTYSEKTEAQRDCSSEPFTKPKLCSTLMNRMKTFSLGSKKQRIALNTSKSIITDIATQLDRVTLKVFGQSQAYYVVDDLTLKECEVFIFRWSKELKNLRSKYRSNLGKFSNAERFERSLECLNNKKDHMQKFTEAQKDFLWLIHILKSLPMSSVCQEDFDRIELLNLYRRWKKGQLISMLPIINFIMETLLNKKDSVLKQRLQNRSALNRCEFCFRIS